MKVGDVVVNNATSEANPYHKLLYLRTDKYIHCYGYDCRKVSLCKEKLIGGEDPVTVVGHMDEVDALLDALQRLNS